MKQDVQKFIDLLTADVSLQEKMKSTAEKYEGEQTQEAVFQEVVSPFAEEAGYHFTWEEYKEYMTDEAAKAKELDLDEMDQVNGGIPDKGGGAIACFAIGIGLGGGVIGSRRTPLAGGCLLVGIGVGAIACAGDGVGEGPSHPA